MPREAIITEKKNQHIFKVDRPFKDEEINVLQNNQIIDQISLYTYN